MSTNESIKDRLPYEVEMQRLINISQENANAMSNLEDDSSILAADKPLKIQYLEPLKAETKLSHAPKL